MLFYPVVCKFGEKNRKKVNFCSFLLVSSRSESKLWYKGQSSCRTLCAKCRYRSFAVSSSLARNFLLRLLARLPRIQTAFLYNYKKVLFNPPLAPTLRSSPNGFVLAVHDFHSSKIMTSPLLLQSPTTPRSTFSALSSPSCSGPFRIALFQTLRTQHSEI